MLIVTLSSIPPRFSSLSDTLRTLLAQTVKADRILLYIPRRYRRFPDWDGALPEVPAGVEIRRCEQDYGPATKVLPAAFEFRGQDCFIFFCDDDRLYQTNLLRCFLKARQEHPNCCIASAGVEAGHISPGGAERLLQPRARRRWRITDLEFQLRYVAQDLRAGRKRKELPEPPRRVIKHSGYIDVFEGFGGVLVRPEFFESSDGDIPPVMWAVDDVWLSGMVARKNIPIWLMANIIEPKETDSHLREALHTATLVGVTQRDANVVTVDYLRKTYGIWL